MSNEVSKFEKELKLVLSKNFFFKEPNSNKAIYYSLIYLFINIFGVFFDVWVVSSLLSVFYLCYVLGAKGFKVAIPIGVLSLFLAYLFSNIYAVYWLAIHIVISFIIYYSLVNRFSKILLLVFITSFLFLSIALFVIVLININFITYNPESIQNFLNNYLQSVVNIQPDVDIELLRKSFEELKISLPVVLFSYLFVYSLLLIQTTLALLSKEKVIIPVFPRLSNITVNSKVTIFYLLLSFLLYLLMYDGIYDRYSVENLILENFISIIRWIFVFNGLFTCYFFLEQNSKKSTIISKVFLFFAMFIVSFVFELIGILDSILKLREYYLKIKGAK